MGAGQSSGSVADLLSKEKFSVDATQHVTHGSTNDGILNLLLADAIHQASSQWKNRSFERFGTLSM